eukprot:3059304-Pyramimonas_sp.AAC.1
MVFDDSIYENNQLGFGWIRCRHGLRWPTARAPARYIWIDVLQAYAIPMGYEYENRLRSWLTIAYSYSL